MSLLLDFARWETDLPRLERHQAGEMTEHDYEVQAARMAEVNVLSLLKIWDQCL